MSVAVGSLLHSNGAAIGVSLGFSLGGGILTGLVGSYVSETLASYLLPAATDIVAQLDSTREHLAGRRLRGHRRLARRLPRRRAHAHAARRVLTLPGAARRARGPRNGSGLGRRPRAPVGGVTAAGRSVGGSIVMFGRTLSSQRGMYQDFSPSSVSSAGTTVRRMISASREDRDREQQAELLADAVGREHEGEEHRGHDDRRCEDDAADRRRRRP